MAFIEPGWSCFDTWFSFEYAHFKYQYTWASLLQIRTWWSLGVTSKVQCRTKNLIHISDIDLLMFSLTWQKYIYHKNKTNKVSLKCWNEINTVVSNHVNSDHVPSFSCLDVETNRQATSGVYAITVTTSAYDSRRCGRLKVIVIWRRQGNRWINNGVRYPTICLISEIYT